MALALRSARQVQAAAREHLVTKAQEDWEAAAASTSPEADDIVGAQPSGPGGAAAEGPGQAASGRGGGSATAAAAAAVASSLSGQAVVCCLDGSSDAALVRRALELWLQQRAFAWALVCEPGPEAAPGAPKGMDLLRLPAPAQLALCWGDREVLLLALPQQPDHAQAPPREATAAAEGALPAAAAVAVAAAQAQPGTEGAAAPDAGDERPGGTAAAGPAARLRVYASQVWAAVRAAFGDAARTGVCCCAAGQVAALEAAGIACRLALQDPLSAFRLWQPGAEAEAQAAAEGAGAGGGPGGSVGAGPCAQEDPTARLLSAAQRAVLPSWRLQLPLRLPLPARRAARAALLARVLQPPLRALLAARGLLPAHDDVALPLVRAAAGARHAGVALMKGPLLEALASARAQLALLRDHQLPRLAEAALSARAAAAAPPGAPPPPWAAPPLLRLGNSTDVAALLAQLGLAKQKRGRPAAGEDIVLAALRHTLQHLAAAPPQPGGDGGAAAAAAAAWKQAALLLQALLTEARLSTFEAVAEELQRLMDAAPALQPGAMSGAGSGGQSGSGGGQSSSGGSGGSLSGGSSGREDSGGAVLLHFELQEQPVVGAPTTALPVPAWHRMLGPEPLPLPATPTLARARGYGAGGKQLLLPMAAPRWVVISQPSQQHREMADGGEAAAAAAATAAAEALAAEPGLSSPYPCTALLVDAVPAPQPDPGTWAPGRPDPSTAAPLGRARGWVCGGGGGGDGGLAAEEEWVGSTAAVRELLPAAAAFDDAPVASGHAAESEAGGAGLAPGEASLLLARGTASLRRCIAPASEGAMFVGLRFVDLPLAVLAALSGEKCLTEACLQYPKGSRRGGTGGAGRECKRAARRPLEAAGDAWAAAAGAVRCGAAAPLLRFAAAGGGDGAPLPARLAAPAAAGVLLEAIALGDRPGKLAESLGCDAPGAAAALGWLWDGLPRVAALRQRVLGACEKTGWVG
jgi:hypothetical protein